MDINVYATNYLYVSFFFINDLVRQSDVIRSLILFILCTVFCCKKYSLLHFDLQLLVAINSVGVAHAIAVRTPHPCSSAAKRLLPSLFSISTVKKKGGRRNHSSQYLPLYSPDVRSMTHMQAQRSEILFIPFLRQTELPIVFFRSYQKIFNILIMIYSVNRMWYLSTIL